MVKLAHKSISKPRWNNISTRRAKFFPHICILTQLKGKGGIWQARQRCIAYYLVLNENLLLLSSSVCCPLHPPCFPYQFRHTVTPKNHKSKQIKIMRLEFFTRVLLFSIRSSSLVFQSDTNLLSGSDSSSRWVQELYF